MIFHYVFPIFLIFIATNSILLSDNFTQILIELESLRMNLYLNSSKEFRNSVVLKNYDGSSKKCPSIVVRPRKVFYNDFLAISRLHLMFSPKYFRRRTW